MLSAPSEHSEAVSVAWRHRMVALQNAAAGAHSPAASPARFHLSSAVSILCRGKRAGALRLLDGDAGPHIIVAPASLLENWQRELARWCPTLKVAPYFGAARIDLRDELEHWRCAACAQPGCPRRSKQDAPAVAKTACRVSGLGGSALRFLRGCAGLWRGAGCLSLQG